MVVAALTCLALAWWQWMRFESSSGTFQNLGYAFQWPAFAVAVVYAYRRFVVMEDDPGSVAAPGSAPTEIPAGILPDRPTADDPHLAALSDGAPDPVHSEYNAYLAELDRGSRPHTPSHSRPQTPFRPQAKDSQ